MSRPLAVVSFTPFFGGGEVYCERLAQLLRDEFEIHALVSNSELQKRLEAAGVEVSLLRAEWRLAILRESAQWLADFAYAYPNVTVLLNGQAEAHLVTRARRLGLRTVVVRHTDLNLEKNAIKRWLYRQNAQRADAVVCVSGVVAAQHGFVAREKLHVIPHWVTPVPARARAGKSKFTVLFIGRLEAEKGAAELVGAAEALSDVEFVLAGEGSLLEPLRARNLPNVRLLGFQSEVAPLYASADLLVNPSHSEGSSLVVLEAMASGLPCLVSDVPALRETGADGEAAALFRCGDVASLTRAIAELAADPKRRQALAERASEHVRREYSPEQALKSYRAVLQGHTGLPRIATGVKLNQNLPL